MEKGALVNQNRPDGSTPLFIAAQNGHTEMISLLLQHGADVNAAGCTVSPLSMAVQGGYLETCRVLLKNGADPNIHECSPLILAASDEYSDLVKLLLTNGANLDLAIQICVQERWRSCETYLNKFK